MCTRDRCPISPDKNPSDQNAQQSFLRIVEAYEALVEVHSSAKTVEDVDILASIRAFQGNLDRSRHVPGLANAHRTTVAANTEQSAALQLEQFHNGDDVYFTRSKAHLCPFCGGRGGHTAMHQCSNCGGSGLAMTATPNGGMTITGCAVCGGTGVVGMCGHCSGSGIVRVDKKYHIHVRLS